MIKNIFVNLAVKDLPTTKEFWTKLGFTFNPQFTDDKAACLVLGENIYAMLIVPDYFVTFTKKSLIDAHASVEVINALSAESKDEVDTLMNQILAAGGKEPREVQDLGWMYSRAFDDLDGHQWELIWVDLAKAPANPGASQ